MFGCIFRFRSMCTLCPLLIDKSLHSDRGPRLQWSVMEEPVLNLKRQGSLLLDRRDRTRLKIYIDCDYNLFDRVDRQDDQGATGPSKSR